ncbi:hypothetical protein K8I31_12755 [bacterium]|nr:hypothetical protein [bacterium]
MESGTEVKITYEWNYWMTIASLGLIKYQALTEMCETVTALEALSWGD